jgi:hypothetical protein
MGIRVGKPSYATRLETTDCKMGLLGLAMVEKFEIVSDASEGVLLRNVNSVSI